MKHRISALILAAMMIFSGCSGSGIFTEELAEDKTYNFIFVCPILEADYWQMCIEGIEQADRELGTHTTVIGAPTAENYAEETVKCMEQALAAKPDGILTSLGVEGVLPYVKQAENEGIPVIALDSDAPETSRVAFLGSSAYYLGSAAGMELISLTEGKGKVAILTSVDTTASHEIEAQVVDIFCDSIGDYPIEVAEIASTGADYNNAVKEAERLIKKYPDLTAIFNTGTMNVTAAGDVKKKLGRDDVIVIGFDDSEENVRLVRENQINALIVQQPKQMGYRSVHLMKEYIDNGRLTSDVFYTSYVVMNRDNVDTYTETSKSALTVSKTVRVGYYSGDSAFQSGFSDEERKSGYAYEYYQALSNYTGWKYEYVYGTRSEIMDMLRRDEVDIAAGIHATEFNEKNLIFSEKDMGLVNEKLYFAMPKDREDLKRELDYAMGRIKQSATDFTAPVLDKYYNNMVYQELTKAEREWLLDEGVLKIGYLSGDMPYCGRDENGKITGVLSEVLDYMEKHLNTSILPICYDKISDMENALLAGDIDAAFPISSDIWSNEKKGLRQTIPFINDRAIVVYRDAYSESIKERVALCNVVLDTEKYPVSEIVYYDSPTEMIDALVSGREKSFVGCASIVQYLISENPSYKDLNIAYINEPQDFGFVVRADNIVLARILNKTVSQLDSADITNAMVRYASVNNEITFGAFIRRYFAEFIIALSITLAVVVILFIIYIRNVKKYTRKQAEAQAALEEALAAANAASKAKTDFLSSMSHDIRTPMNAISGMTAIASKNLDNRKKLEDCLEKISLSSRYLLTLINDVLDISKIENDDLAMNPAYFSLKQAMDSISSIVRHQFKAKNMDFRMQLHDIAYDRVYADEVRVNQIYMNLISNALKYTPQGGKVKVDLYEEALDDGKNVRLKFIVEDNGVGMTPEFMENMYAAFVRAQDSRTSKIQGIGLGLSIVKRLVEAMEGTIDCQSEVGKGTKFTVVLEMPRGEKSDDTEGADDPRIWEKAIQGKCLLVAEDNDLNWEVVSELLAMIEVKTARAENGKVCVEMLEAAPNKYDAVLMDVQMPVMNGRDAARLIRKSKKKRLSKIPIIAMTADAFAEDIAACKEAGMDGHVSKPIDMDNLCQEVYKALTSR